jgi:riboflavin kinase
MENLRILKHLATMGAVKDFIPLSSGELAKRLGISQQSASKKILELIAEGIIERRFGTKKPLIKITKKGVGLLQKEYSEYQRIFETLKKLSVKGVVISGMDEGRYYLTLKGYKEQLKRKLRFSPYEGTLNLKLFPGESGKLNILKESVGINIDGFQDGERTFGPGKCFPAKIRNVDCAVIMPNRSHYSDVVEIISKDYLREKLKLKDGDMIEVEIRL